MIISTTITRNKKPSQAVYQMANPEPPVQNEPIVDSKANPEPPVQNEPIVDSKVVLGDDKLDETDENSNQVNPIEIGSSDDSMNVEKESETVIDSEAELDQNDSIEEDESFESEQESEQSFQEEQSQIEKTEEAPKKKTSSKKK